MKTLQTKRLNILPFTLEDLKATHQISDRDLQWGRSQYDVAAAKARPRV